jgi:alpha-L-fucosidase 2
MVFGNVEKEVIKLNEATVWSGGPTNNDNHDALKALPQVRQLIYGGKYAEAQALAGANIQTKKNNGMKFQPVGNLNLFFPGHENYKDYYRELDLWKRPLPKRYIQ